MQKKQISKKVSEISLQVSNKSIEQNDDPKYNIWWE